MRHHRYVFRLLSLSAALLAACTDPAASRLIAPVERDLVAAAPPGYDPYVVSELALPAGYVGGEAKGINSSDVIVGDVYKADGYGRAVAWINGVPKLLPNVTFGTLQSSSAHDIRDDGRIVGELSYCAGGQCARTAVTWNSANAASALAIAAGLTATQGSTATALGATGLAVGFADRSSGAGHAPYRFSTSPGGATALPLPSGYVGGEASDVNASDAIVGEVYATTGSRGVVWRRLLGAAFVATLLPQLESADGIGDDGSIYGIRAGTDDAVRVAPNGTMQVMWTVPGRQVGGPSSKGRAIGCGWLARTWRNGSLTTLYGPYTQGDSECARGVNTCGTVVGSTYGPAGDRIPVRWRKQLCD